MTGPLIVGIPDSWQPERRYVLDTVIGDWLGLDHVVEPDRGVTIRLHGDPDHRELRLPDTLFSTPPDRWLTESSLPVLPLASLALPGGERLPVLYGSAGGPGSLDDPRPGERVVELPLDVFGAIFFLLTRYEEAAGDPVRDRYGRFPAAASVAATGGFLDRPIADEYAALLGRSIGALWPSLSIRTHPLEIRPGHDVDQPFAVHGEPAPAIARALAGDVVRRRDPGLAARRARAWIISLGGGVRQDPYDSFDAIMAIGERSGWRSTFHFVALDGDGGPLDPRYRLSDPSIQQLLARIADRGHGIGLHVGYEAYRSPAGVAAQFDRLRSACRELGIEQDAWGSRQHYLRFDNPASWRALDAAGLDWDATLGFADHVGFRSGTAREHRVFDLGERRPLRLRSRPLVAMDTTFVEYMGVPAHRAGRPTLDLLAAASAHGGSPAILWHNNLLSGPRERRAYEALLRGAAALARRTASGPLPP